MCTAWYCQDTEYDKVWHKKVKHPTRWLMGIITRALRDDDD